MIQVDSREKAHIIKHILDDFDDMGVPWFSCKLPVGDYVNLDNPRISVDRKHNLAEVVNNVGQDHKRFVAELARAQKLGIKLVILIEHSRNIRSVEDVLHWKNPRLAVSPLAISGERLYKIMISMTARYGVEWQFCEKRNTAKRICEILNIT
jgi:ERCC4-type nuclease